MDCLQIEPTTVGAVPAASFQARLPVGCRANRSGQCGGRLARRWRDGGRYACGGDYSARLDRRWRNGGRYARAGGGNDGGRPARAGGGGNTLARGWIAFGSAACTTFARFSCTAWIGPARIPRIIACMPRRTSPNGRMQSQI